MKKNKIKEIICLLISLSVLIYNPLLATANDFSGVCGNDIEWYLNTDIGLLNISGVSNDMISHHNMNNYNSYNETPWASYKNSINSVKISGRINNVGNHAFDNCTNLTSVVLGHLDYPNFVGNRAFYNCAKLEQFKYEGSAQPDCGTEVFNGSNKLNEVMVPADYADNKFCGLPIKRQWSSSDYGFVVLMSTVSALVGMFAAIICRMCPGKSGSSDYGDAGRSISGIFIPLD